MFQGIELRACELRSVVRALGIINMFSTLGGAVFGGKEGQRVSLGLGQRNHSWAWVGEFWRPESLCVS